jgi:hypothetical protein
MFLTEDSRFQIAAGVHFCTVDSDVVLLNPANGLYYGLDTVGSRIWSLLGDRVTLGTIRDVLAREFEVTPETAWQDLTRLVGEMQSQGLVIVYELEPDGGGPGA